MLTKHCVTICIWSTRQTKPIRHWLQTLFSTLHWCT